MPGLFFSKLLYNLAKRLLEKNLTLLKTIKAHRREIPTTLNNRIKLFSSVFWYNHEDGVCLVVYQAEKNKKRVMLLSSTHTENSVTTDEYKNPLMILDNNQRKDVVDMFDENLEKFLCRQKLYDGLCCFCTTWLTLQPIMPMP